MKFPVMVMTRWFWGEVEGGSGDQTSVRDRVITTIIIVTPPPPTIDRCAGHSTEIPSRYL